MAEITVSGVAGIEEAAAVAAPAPIQGQTVAGQRQRGRAEAARAGERPGAREGPAGERDEPAENPRSGEPELTDGPTHRIDSVA